MKGRTMKPLILVKGATPLFLVALLLACFAFSPIVRAVNPPPDGGYPGGNTAVGLIALFSLTTGGFNTAVGVLSLYATTAGSFNTAVGSGALDLNTADNNTAIGAAALLLNTTGNDNTAVGTTALAFNTASGNTAVGFQALFSNTTGGGNMATGLQALFSNVDGIRNTATGVYALNHNVSGGGNTAVGYQALANNTAANNTATGNDALVFNTAGAQNTANGNAALANNTTGDANTAVGFNALTTNTDSKNNTAIGWGALASNTGFIGNGNNTAVGWRALESNTSGISNTANGVLALSSNTIGSENVALGAFAGSQLTAGNGNIEISNPGVAGEANTTRIGAFQTRAFIAGINGVALGSGTAVQIDPSGQLGTFISSRRFKKDIHPMDKASESILALKPVTFHYKTDAKGIPQFGLVAEEVDRVSPDLVVRDKNGEIYSVRYEAVNAMLLNEFLKEHRTVQEQKATIAQLEKGMKTVIARLDEQDSKIEKVNTQVAVSKPAPQIVDNNQ
jgi:hypothetical protein